MAYIETFAQAIGVIDKINSQSVNNTNTNSIGVNMNEFRRVAYLVELQSAGAAGVLNAVLQASVNSNFAGAVALNATVSLNASNTAALLEVRADQVAQALASNNAANMYVRCQLQPSGNAVTVELWGFGKDAVQRPGSQNNLNTSFLTTEVASSL